METVDALRDEAGPPLAHRHSVDPEGGSDLRVLPALGAQQHDPTPQRQVLRALRASGPSLEARSPIAWTPGCSLDCRRCTQKACEPPKDSAQPGRCAGPANCGPAWSIVRLRCWLGSMLISSSSAPTGTGHSGRTWPTRPLALLRRLVCRPPYTSPTLGRARLSKFLWRHSRGAWGDAHANRLLELADETLTLWGDELDYGELADDIAVEARPALQLTTEIHELEQRITVFLRDLDPAGIMTSVPGVGVINGAQILARLGDPKRFRSLVGARSFSGLVPSLDASGVNGRHGLPTKSGDAPLREALFMAADVARKVDPTLAARYHRLMVQQGKHHNSALCHVSTVLLTRIVACWRRGTPYLIRDVGGTLLMPDEARRIVMQRYQVGAELREQRHMGRKMGTSGRNKESQGAPSTKPVPVQG